MRVGIDKRPIVVLAVNFNERLADLPHQLNAHRLVVDERLGAAVGRLHAAEDQIAIVVDAVLAQEEPRRMAGRDVEDSGNLAPVLAVAHERTVAAAAQRKRQTVEKNGFARAGFAGQHRKPGIEAEVKPFDQDDIADRELGEHPVSYLRCQAPGKSRADEVLPARAIQDVPVSRGSSPPDCSSL